MRRRLFLGLALFAALTLFSYGASAAIAFVAAADLGNNGGGSNSLTAAYTVGGGSDRFLWVQVTGDSAGGSDDITGVTYNSVAMTFAVKQVAGSGQDRNVYLYYLANPASGAHNVVVSCTNTHYLLVGAADYTGVNATGQPDGTNAGMVLGSASPTITVTTTVNNDWAVAVNQGPHSTAGTGTTSRTVDAAFDIWHLYDSGAAITPAQSYSMTIAYNGAATSAIIAAGFQPVGAGFTNRPGPRMGPALPFGL